MENEMARLSDRDYIVKIWKQDGEKVLEAIDGQNAKAMTGDEFLNHCTACGGNWGGMLLTGINELYPEVWEAIPDNMGIHAWAGICTVLNLLQIKFEER